MSNPIISVVMPVYNAEKYLDEAIQSILNQTFVDFEFIIINDGSTDDSLAIIKSYAKQDKRIRFISRENKGLVASLNKGIQIAKGKYIARMDADDISLPTRFKQQVKVLDEMDVIDAVSCAYQAIDINSNISNNITSPPIDNKDILMTLCATTPIAHPTVMMRKIIFSKITYQDNPAEDYLLWSQAYQDDNFYNTSEVYCYIRINYGQSFSDTKRSKMVHAENDIAKQFFYRHEQQITTTLNNHFVKNIFFARAMVMIFIISNKGLISKLLLKHPDSIPIFFKYYTRHYIKFFYWKFKDIIYLFKNGS